MTTKTQYTKAIDVVRNYIREQIIANAKKEWDSNEDLRAEHEQDNETYEDYLRIAIENAMEDECPGGVNVDEDIFCTFTDD